MMSVGEMRMGVPQSLMAMPMGVADAGRYRDGVLMLVVRVVDVGMLVIQSFVRVFVLVALGEMQPETQAHDSAGREHLPGHGIMK